MEFLGYVFAVLMGLSLGIIGGGGSILTVPILVYFFKLDAVIATTVSLFIVGATALLGAVMNARRGLINIKTGITFAVPSFVGVYFARKLVLPSISDTIILPGGFVITKSIIILLSFAILMIFASQAMIRSGKGRSSSLDGLKHGVLSIGIKGFLVGCTTGFVGAGGGFLIVPALVILLHVPMRVAIGTSLAVIAANSLFGFAISMSSLIIDWTLLLTITLLGVIGLVFGHQVSHRLPENNLKQGFGYFVLAIGCLILLDQILKMS